jgi:hypothetical protein
MFRKILLGSALVLAVALFGMVPPWLARAQMNCTVDPCFFSGGQITGLRDTFVDQYNNETIAGDKTFAGNVVIGGQIRGYGGEVVTTTNVIGAIETGYTFFLTSSGGFVSTLPAPAIGLQYTFVVATAPTGGSGYTVVTNASANILNIVAMAGGGADAADVATARDLVTFVNDAAVVGDWIYCISDGTSWQCRGGAAVAAGLTTGQT